MIALMNVLKKYSDWFQDPVQVQLLGMLFTLAGILVAFVVYRLQKKEEKVFATTVLAEEIESNIALINAYIQHSDVGANLTQGTYELNVPERIAYDQYYGLVCQNNVNLAQQMRQLYLQFSAAKVIIEMNHNFVATNLLTLFTAPKEELLSKGVITLNHSLKGLSDSIKNNNNIPILIQKLKS